MGAHRYNAMNDSGQAPLHTVFGSVRRLGVTTLAILHTRLSLAGVELEEEIQRLVGALVLALGLVLFAALALLVFTLMVVFWLAPDNRVGGMAIIAVLYAAIAAVLAWQLRRLFLLRPPIFSATLAELEKDRNALRTEAASSTHEVSSSGQSGP